METKKKTIIEVQTTDGKTVEIGQKVLFSCSGKCFAGVFDGIDNRGNWKFAGIETFKDVYFTVAPRSIQRMYLADFMTMAEPLESEE